MSIWVVSLWAELDVIVESGGGWGTGAFAVPATIFYTTTAPNSIDRSPENRALHCSPFDPTEARHPGIVALSSPFVRCKQAYNLVLPFDSWCPGSPSAIEWCLRCIIDFREPNGGGNELRGESGSGIWRQPG